MSPDIQDTPDTQDARGARDAPQESPAGPTGQTYTLQQFPERLAVVRLPPGAEVPSWAESSSLLSITATATETSLVCAGRDVPTKVVAQRGLIAFAVQGPLDLALVGVLAALLTPLAEEGVPVFTISTYDTDWILVPGTQAERAGEAWARRGHVVVPAVPVTPPRKGRR